jgi:hypothetical protein
MGKEEGKGKEKGGLPRDRIPMETATGAVPQTKGKKKGERKDYSFGKNARHALPTCVMQSKSLWRRQSAWASL